MRKLSSTPFCGNKDYMYVARKKNDRTHTDCSVKMIENLIAEGQLNQIDIEILKQLFEYRALNAYLIEKLLKRTIFMRKENYLSNLNKLREYGIILYYEKDDNQAVYTLSDGAKVYMYLRNGEKRRHISSFKESLSGMEVNKTVASNLMLINLDFYDKKIKKYPVRHDYLRFFSVKYREKLNFVIAPVRRGDTYMNVLLEAAARAEGLFFSRNYYVIALCEDVRHFDELNEGLQHKSLLESRILYTTDRMAIANGAMGMYVKGKNNYSSVDFVKYPYVQNQ